MNSIKNLERTPISIDILSKLVKIYEFKGRLNEIIKTYSNLHDVLMKKTISEDAEYIGRIMKLDVTDHKYKMITSKNIKPKNNEEKLLQKILKSQNIIHTSKANFTLSTVGILQLQQYIFSTKSFKVEYESYRTNKEIHTKRKLIDELVDMFKLKNDDKSIETLLLISAFYIDFVNIKPFKKYNDITSIMLLQLLLKAFGFDIVDYISIVRHIYMSYNLYEQAINESSYNWNIGFPQFIHFTEYLISLLNNLYIEFNGKIREVKFDSKYNKIELVENIINQFNGIFTKDHIRELNPYVSESTINRALKEMKDNGSIEPIGKGRSAKWKKLY